MALQSKGVFRGKEIICGKQFAKAALQWYSGLSSNYPKLDKDEFPRGLKVNVLDILEYGNYRKAISVDCIDGSLFRIENDEEQQNKKRKIMFLEHLFQKEFWEYEQSKRCLVGRLVLLNKDHPKTHELGRFRPIRICSNVVKFLQASLYSKLARWGESNLRQQFGFVKAVSCENLRTFVFRQMRGLINQNTPFLVTQIDLSSAYNTVNLWILKNLIQREGFWNPQEIQLWQFLNTHSKSWFQGEEVQDINGLPQGSLLSPLLFDLYINDLFVGLRSEKNLRVLGYADDLIAITPDKKQMSKFILETKRFCNKRMLTVNEKKSDVLLFGYPSIKNFQGIPIRLKAKYLGVSYERDLSIEKANRKFLPKIRWISSRLWKLLRDSDFRTRFNLWQVFIAPLHRMAVSIIGISNTYLTQMENKKHRKCVRQSLRRFIRSPRYTPIEILDCLSQVSDENINELLEKNINRAFDRLDISSEEDLFCNSESFNTTIYKDCNSIHIKWFNPEIDQILKIINRNMCLVHSKQVLNRQHIEKDHKQIIKESRKLIDFLFGEKEFEGWRECNKNMKSIQGPSRFQDKKRKNKN